ncbi:cation transporting ATPase [Melanogaster broomeanus]|nr:cation transporting ATPase [Melanogaster broomeanus]
MQTLVFNAFVFAQIFNSVNSRRFDRKENVFEGLLRNYYFIVITLIEIVVQVLIVFVGGAAFQVTIIGGREWSISLALGVVSIPLGALIRLLPNEPFEKLFIAIRLLPSPEALPTIKPDAEWNLAIELVRDDLATFANLRRGVTFPLFIVSRLQFRYYTDFEFTDWSPNHDRGSDPDCIPHWCRLGSTIPPLGPSTLRSFQVFYRTLGRPNFKCIQTRNRTTQSFKNGVDIIDLGPLRHQYNLQCHDLPGQVNMRIRLSA